MSRIKGIKNRKSSKKIREVHKKRYLPPQRLRQDETAAEHNFEEESKTEETQDVLLKEENDFKELSEQYQVHVEPCPRWSTDKVSIRRRRMPGLGWASRLFLQEQIWKENHEALSLFSNWMRSFMCLLLLFVIFTFLAYVILNVDNEESLLVWYLVFLR
ncbi:unnamed protein product [Larinioides sclopetarius]|uniref:Uncharacterized protein n=1 Tax=Larinioides sclopetarius TaxID=280406 RepID=A0AAV2B485_9ARAC